MGSEMLTCILVMVVHYYNVERHSWLLFIEQRDKDMALKTNEDILQSNPNSIWISVEQDSNVKQIYEN